MTISLVQDNHVISLSDARYIHTMSYKQIAIEASDTEVFVDREESLQIAKHLITQFGFSEEELSTLHNHGDRTMIDLLNFVFMDFWHFAGCVIILAILISPFVTLAAAMERKDK